MKVTVAYELPEDFTEVEIESFTEALGTAAFENIKTTYEYRGRDAAEEVAHSEKIEKQVSKEVKK